MACAIEFHVASTDEWVSPEFRVPADEDGLRIYGIGNDGLYTIMYVDIPGNSWNQNRLNKFIERANQLAVHRIPLTDPSLVDDPYGPNGTDPNNYPKAFWDGGDLCCQTVIFSDATYDSTTQTLNFVRTRAF